MSGASGAGQVARCCISPWSNSRNGAGLPQVSSTHANDATALCTSPRNIAASIGSAGRSWADGAKTTAAEVGGGGAAGMPAGVGTVPPSATRPGQPISGCVSAQCNVCMQVVRVLSSLARPAPL